MTTILTAPERRRIIDAIGQFIQAKRNLLQFVIDGVNAKDDPSQLDSAKRIADAQLQIELAANKLENVHPDADLLPIPFLRASGDWFALYLHNRNAGIIEWQISQLELLKKTICKGGKVNPRDKHCYQQMKKHVSLQRIKNDVRAHDEWQPLHSPQAVSQAAKRYAVRHCKPWPIPR